MTQINRHSNAHLCFAGKHTLTQSQRDEAQAVLENDDTFDFKNYKAKLAEFVPEDMKDDVTGDRFSGPDTDGTIYTGNEMTQYLQQSDSFGHQDPRFND